MNFPVDIVYTWVDNKDPIWKEKKKKALHEININPEANEDCRFISSNELLYSIRSIYKYCSWFNKIYIITDSQKPTWLNPNIAEIVIIDHKTIFDNNSTFPFFNSNVIESRIHYIPNLCEHFIYFNDDLFIGRKLNKNYFFSKNGTPKLYMTPKKSKRKVIKGMNSRIMLKQKLYPRNLNNARKLVWEKYKTLILNYPIHNPKAFRKTDILKVESIFKKYIVNTLNHQFRNNEGIYFLALCMFHMITEGVTPIIMKPYRSNRLIYKIPLLSKNRDFIYIKLGFDRRFEEKCKLICKFNPAFFCINDTNFCKDSDRKNMVKFLADYYYDKTIAEK